MFPRACADSNELIQPWEQLQMAKTPRDKFWDRAIAELSKQVKFLPERKMEQNLEMACGEDVCEAFRMGAWEAQRELIRRLRTLQGKLTAEPVLEQLPTPSATEPQ